MAPFPTVLLLLVICAWALSVGGLPGGGTSLLISPRTVAILPEFTALAHSNSFTLEVWYNAFLAAEMGYAVELATPAQIQLVSINIYEGEAPRPPRRGGGG